MRLFLPVLLLTASIVVAESPVVPHLPTDLWRVGAQPGDRVELKESDGILTVDYDIDVDQTHQVGHQTFNQVAFRLLLKQAVPLDEPHRRIIFEAAGLSDHDSAVNKRVLICPVIVDQNGEYLIYTPYKYPHLKSGGTGWSQWMSSDFFAGEAGGATQDVFEPEGGDQNAWPDGRLAFAGFQVNVRNPQFGRRQGKVRLGRIAIGGIRIPSETPFAYADSLLTAKGAYRLAAGVYNEFQGAPVREIDQTVAFDPADFASRRQRLMFPLGRDDNYWIDYQITDAAGNVVQSDSMRYQVNASGDRAAPAPVDAAAAPALGNLRINCDKPGRGVYGRGEPLDVQVRVFPKGARELAVGWKLTPWLYEDVLDQGTNVVAFSGKPFEDLALKLKGTPGRDAYRLQLTVTRAGVVCDSRTYCLGYRTDLGQRHDREGRMTDRDELKRHTYYRTTYVGNERGVKSAAEAAALFREYAANAKQAAENITYMLDLADFEVLPGVFDFSMLDGVMDAAADYGCKVTVRLAHADGQRTYRWPKFSRQHSYDGTEIEQHYYGAYAVSDPRTTQLWLDSYRALFERYRRHTAFQGYYVMQPGGEWTVVDKPWEGVIAGYDPASAAGFRNYLKGNLNLTLDGLNGRWGSSYTSWSEIEPPPPELKMGAAPDLRMSWVDFNRFKASLGTEFWFPLAINSIREYDTNRLTIAYGSPKRCKLLYGKLDYCHNGGNHYGNDAGQFVDAWEHGKIGWITEPHHPHRWAAYGDPAQKGWVLDWSTWVMISQAGGGGANLHIYYMPNPTLDLAAHYGGAFAYDRFESFKPMLEELVSFKLQGPPVQVAVTQDPYTLYCKHRTTFGARLDDLNRWFDLLKDDSVAFEELTPEREANYKLLLPNVLDEVMSAESIANLDRLVRAGAKMVIAANTGKYSPELGREPFQLLKRLGIPAPQGAYVQSRTEVAATVTADNPLFATGDKLSFFTLAELRRDLQSDAVKKDFWKYPYRWIPQTDYFGFYPDNRQTGGTVLARFAEGGTALSRHRVGEGEVMVFWGTPDLRGDRLKGMMAQAAGWAGAASPRRGSPIPHTLEGHSDKLKRHYALLYQENAGTYTQKLATVPDGDWFLDDLISSQKLGLYTGRELRENGLALTFAEGYSPLKVIRMIPAGKNAADWSQRYRQLPKAQAEPQRKP